MPRKTETRSTSSRSDRVSRELASAANDLAKLGLIDKHRLATINALCFDEPPVYSARRVADIRIRKARMSQAVFAKLLNVSVSTVQKWEAPLIDKRPRGAAAKLLQLIDRKGIETLM